MNKSVEKKQKDKSWISLFIGLLGLLGGSVASAIFSVAWYEALVIVSILIGMGVVCWCVTTLIMWGYQSAEKKALQETKNEGNVICNIENRICCAMETLKGVTIDFKIDEQTKEHDRIYSAKELEEIELGINRPWSNIWIFSENLSTEISKSGQAESVVITNIYSHMTKYSMFYINDENELNEIESRKQKLLASLRDAKDKKNLMFYPLDSKSGYIGYNTLPLLCGSILFSDKSDATDPSLPFFESGYLSMRKDMSGDVIYYKMTKCMLRQYARYFKNQFLKKENK